MNRIQQHQNLRPTQQLRRTLNWRNCSSFLQARQFVQTTTAIGISRLKTRPCLPACKSRASGGYCIYCLTRWCTILRLETSALDLNWRTGLVVDIGRNDQIASGITARPLHHLAQGTNSADDRRARRITHEFRDRIERP